MAVAIHTAQVVSKRDGGLSCYGVVAARPAKAEPALHTDRGVCSRGGEPDADLASLRAAIKGMEWFSYSTAKLPIGEQGTLYADRGAVVSFIEQARSSLLTGRRGPSKLEGGQGVDFTLSIRLRTLLGKCRGLALGVYDPHQHQEALELAERSLVAELEESRRARAGEVELTPLGKGLFRASGGYEVDAMLVHCECKDFEINNAGRLGRYPVRCKHIFAAQAWMGGPAAAAVSRTVYGKGGARHVGSIGG